MGGWGAQAEEPRLPFRPPPPSPGSAKPWPVVRCPSDRQTFGCFRGPPWDLRASPRSKMAIVGTADGPRTPVHRRGLASCPCEVAFQGPALGDTCCHVLPPCPSLPVGRRPLLVAGSVRMTHRCPPPPPLVMTAYRALIRPSGEDAMGRSCILDSHPRKVDARSSADARSSTDACLS